jgi:hypothetical protein
VPDEKYKANPADPQEACELLRALFALAETGEKVMADGKVTIMDVPALVGVAMPMIKGIVGAEKIGDEIKAMNAEGEAKLKETVTEFEFADEDVERLSERAMNWLIETSSLVVDFVHTIRQKKVAVDVG